MDKSYQVTFFQYCRDNHVKISQSVQWEELVQLFSNHQQNEQKDGLMFNGVMYIDKLHEPFIRRCSDNVEAITLMILDYDGGMTINAAKKQFKKYNYLGYTSHSHRLKKKGGKDCFRIVLPLLNPVDADVYRNKKDSILAWSNGADGSSVDVGRAFYLPACPPDMYCLSECWVNVGELVDIDMFEDRKEPEMTIQQVETSDDDRSEITNRLKNRFIGKEPVWYRIGIAMASNGFTKEQFINATVNGMMKEKTIQNCVDKWGAIQKQVSRGKQINVGYIINVLKGKH